MKPGESKSPMEGVTIRRNAKNKFIVFELHYRADPAKRDPAYIETIKASMPIRQFKQEYDLVWDSFAGLSVYADWDVAIHGLNRRVDPHIGLPLLVGIDFGLTPAIVVGQLQEETLYILKEYTAVNMGVKRFLTGVIPQMKADFPMWLDLARDFICFIDPSGFFRKDTDETTCASVMESLGFRNIVPGPVQWEERRNAVETWLTRRTRRGPCFQVSLPNCPLLVQGFNGGYRYPEGVLEKEPTQKLRPIKDRFSHCFKAGVLVETPSGLTAIEDLRIGDRVNTPLGVKSIVSTMNSISSDFVTVHLENGATLECTSDHPIWNGFSFVRADALQCGSSVLWHDPVSTHHKTSRVLGTIESLLAIIRRTTQSAASTCTERFGSFIGGLFHPSTTYTTKTGIRPITDSRTSKWFWAQSMYQDTAKQPLPPTLSGLKNKLPSLKSTLKSGTVQLRAENGTVNMLFPSLRTSLSRYTGVFFVEMPTRPRLAQENAAFAQRTAKAEPDESQVSITSKSSANSVQRLISATNTTKPSIVRCVVRQKQEPVRVYDLTVEDAHCFYANGFLVGNCHDALQYLCAKLLGSTRTGVVQVPKPTYSFLSQHD